jgi:hypothetical protein
VTSKKELAEAADAMRARTERLCAGEADLESKRVALEAQWREVDATRLALAEAFAEGTCLTSCLT